MCSPAAFFVYITGATWQPSPDGKAALPRRMLSTGTSSLLTACVPSAPCQMQGTIHDLKSGCASLCVEEGGEMQMLALAA